MKLMPACMRSHPLQAAALLALAGAAGGARAQTVYQWSGAGDGQSFGSSLNWLPQGVPGSLDSAEFDTVGPHTVVLSRSRSVFLTAVENHDVMLRAGSFAYTTTGLIVGERLDDFGSLRLDSGSLTTGNDMAIVGKFAGSAGVLSIGAGTSLTCQDDLIVGDGGSGSLLVESGAAASTPLLFLADESGSVGTATVRGTLTISQSALLGNGGAGTLDVLGGGDIVCGSSFKIGDNALSSGTVRVSGSGSTLSAQGDSRVGNLGSGSLAIESGGSVSVANLTVGDDSDGTLRVRGGSSLLTASGGVLIGNNAGSSGLLRLENGGRLTAPTLTVSEFGRAEGAGTVQASVLNGGVVRPGAPIGRLSVTGSYTQVGGLEIELSGFAAGSEYDQLSASGSVTLGGSLDVALTGGFNPGSGEFVVVQGGSISGSFATVTLPPDFEISYESTRVVVSRNSGCGADFNGDGSVNTQDVIAFLNAWSSGHASADMNGDGNINTQDVILFLNLWTAGC